MSWRFAALDEPDVIVERLPKSLIHRNVPGEPIHAFVNDLRRCWEHNAALAAWGRRQRFIATALDLSTTWPVRTDRHRLRLGELTVDWSAVAPVGGP